jgi:uncharacterized protein (DUF608 family)
LPRTSSSVPGPSLPASHVLASGLPLGGIGSGGIELWADGVFRAPNFTNPGPWGLGYSYFARNGVSDAAPYSVEDQFFILRVVTATHGEQFRFLFTGHGTAFNSWGHMPRTYKYARIPAMAAIEHEEVFPFTRLRYVDAALPVEVSLEAWTPFVPHDVGASSLPGAYFDFKVLNRGAEPAEVSILHACTNLAGWDQDDFQQRHEVVELPGGARAVVMRGGRGEHATTGDLAIFASAPTDGGRVAAVEANPWLENIIWPFMKGGDVDGPLHMERLARTEYFQKNAAAQLASSRWTMAPGLHRNRAWTSLRASVDAGATQDYAFGLAWFFPHHHDRNGFKAGKAYARRFADSGAVAAHLVATRAAYRERSSVWPALVASSTLEPAFAATLLDQLSTLVKSTWLTAEGDYFIWEGLGHASMNTVDVEHYGSFALALLFPQLRARVTRQTVAAQRPDGQIAHGYCVRPADIPAGEYIRMDVNAQFILAAFREWRWTGDARLLADVYPGIALAARRLLELDRHKLGLPWTEGGITYDHWHLKGVVTYMAVLHLAALQAAATLARAVGATADADTFVAAWVRGRDAAEALLWDEAAGRYRIVNRGNIPATPAHADAAGAGDAATDMYAEFYGVHGDTPRLSIDDGLHTDALNGDVCARLLGLPEALRPDRVRGMTELIEKTNRHRDGRFLANGTCADDSYPDEWPLAQWHNPWTGIEYFFAAQLFQQGLVGQGVGIIRDVYDRMAEGGVRFNHPECGNHYSRALSIYAAYLAYTGIEHIALEQRLVLLPCEPLDGHRLPLLTTGLLGELAIAADRWTVRIATGSAGLRALTLPAALRLESVAWEGTDSGPLTARPDPERADATRWTWDGEIALQAGGTLVLALAPAAGSAARA